MLGVLIIDIVKYLILILDLMVAILEKIPTAVYNALQCPPMYKH